MGDAKVLDWVFNVCLLNQTACDLKVRMSVTDRMANSWVKHLLAAVGQLNSELRSTNDIFTCGKVGGGRKRLTCFMNSSNN